MKTLHNISKINIKLTLILSVLVMLWSLESNASVYGILKGKVLDSDGKPVIGASVRVLGTTRGAKVKEDGEFTIVNILAGNYKVKVAKENYQNYYKDITIIADSTIELLSINLEKRYEGYLDNLEMLDTLNKTNLQELTSTAKYGISKTVRLNENGCGPQSEDFKTKPIYIFDTKQSSKYITYEDEMENGIYTVYKQVVKECISNILDSRNIKYNFNVRVDGIDVNNQFTGHGYSYESVNVNSKEHVLQLMDKIHLKGKVGILDNLVPIKWI